MVSRIKTQKVNKVKHSHRCKKSKTKLKLLKGGKYLDEGGFGCVVKPALSCKHLPSHLNLNNYVSKIISNPNDSDDIEDEIQISKLLKHLDKDIEYFITIKDYCYINTLPKDRTNVVDVEYKNDKRTKYDIPKHLTLDKKYCAMDLNDRPMNLIIPFGGISLSKIIKIDRKDTYNMKARIHQLFVTHIKLFFKHLLMGIEIMHRSKIVNRDIKQKNIMIYVEPSMLQTLQTIDLKTINPNIKKMMKVRYIDFGLSTYITSAISSNLKNLNLSGTFRYLAPELFISHYLIKYRNKSTQYKIEQINENINKHVKKAFDRIKETSVLNTLNDKINVLIKKIQYVYENNKLLDKFFGINTIGRYNGYLQKADVYALGITIFDTLQLEKHSNMNVREDTLLYDLLLKMIEINPDDRINVIECINHPYFKS